MPGDTVQPWYWYWLGPGNTNVRGPGYWVGEGSTHPVYPSQVHPWYARHRWYTSDMRVLTCSTGVLRSAKEILGCKTHMGIRGTLEAVSALPPPYASSSTAPPSAPTQVYLRYISVISQVYLSS